MSLEIAFTKKRHAFRWIFLVLFVAVLASSGIIAYRWYEYGDVLPFSVPLLATADTSVDESNVSSLQISQYTVPALNPRFINIPSLNLADIRIYPVTVASNNGLLGYASNIHDVGWYQKSDTPGDGGVVVLDGHSKGLTQNGPFVDAANLKNGDKIMIKRGDGVLITYAVVDVQTLTTDNLYTTGLSLMSKAAQDGTESLNIVADAGKWIPKLKMFDHRILIRSSLVTTTAQ